jgi:hypothetical protein
MVIAVASQASGAARRGSWVMAAAAGPVSTAGSLKVSGTASSLGS